LQRKEAIKEFLEKEIGRWLDKNANLITSKYGVNIKVYPLLCGSYVEGFATRGSDVDIAVLVEGIKRIDKDINDTFREYIKALNESEELKRLGISHICGVKSLRTTSWLLSFKRSKNPAFRAHFFLFSELLHPKVRSDRIKEILADEDDLRELKLELINKYRERFGYEFPFEIADKCFKIPENYGLKRIYRQIQLVINSFIMLYGVGLPRELKEYTEEELMNKFRVVLRSSLSKEIYNKYSERLIEILQRIRELRDEVKRLGLKNVRLKGLVRRGIIKQEELRKIELLMEFIYHLIYKPLKDYYELHARLVEALTHLGWKIRYLGLRATHAYIAIDHPIINCIDIIPLGDNEHGYALCLVVKNKWLDSFERLYGTVILVEVKEEIKFTETLKVRVRVHRETSKVKRRGKYRKHFKVATISKDFSPQQISKILRNVVNSLRQN